MKLVSILPADSYIVINKRLNSQKIQIRTRLYNM